MEMCWLTTERCNQHCNYCDRFQDQKKLSTKDYHTILDKLILYGVKKLTFGGGESLMVDCFADIVKKGFENGIHFKLGTNGKLLLQSADIIPYLGEITLSIDSVNPMINEKLGRGSDHYENIQRAIAFVREKKQDFRININTVVTKINLDNIVEMSEFITGWEIPQWRIFRFCPLRGTAVRNRETFEITDEQFSKVCESVRALNLKCKVQFRNYTDMEKGYLLITPAGKLCISRNMKDIEVGDMLTEDLSSYFK